MPDSSAVNSDTIERPHDGLAFLSGGGEMGARMRALDWSKTAVGEPEGWPAALKAAVAICLGSRYPMVIWWGNGAYTQFYNDGYAPILGKDKHPRCLGQSGRDCWSEIWSVMGPMWDEVFRTGEANWSEDFLYVLNRNLPREEGYFTFSYSPIREENGEIGGIFCACNEATARVVGERRLKTLRDLGRVEAGARTVQETCEVAAQALGKNANDVPFALIYLVNDDAHEAQLAAASGIAPGDKAAPLRIALTESQDVPDQSIWPLAAVRASGSSRLVSGLKRALGEVPAGPWPEGADAAMVVPIAAPGQAVTGQSVAGFLIAGISPRRVLDGDYAAFLDLAAGHVGASLANARASEAERQRIEALAEIDRAKSQFFSNVSHEFRTPLTLLLGPLDEILSRKENTLSPDDRSHLAMAHRNGQRLLKLVNSLLEFSRLDAGRVHANRRAIDLAQFTGELASNFRAACDKAGIFLDITVEPASIPAMVDPDMWETIVLNLLSNAFKYTLRGGIIVALRSDGARVSLSIHDTGIGIPKNELPKLFERFHRVEQGQGRSMEGSGIGLALVRQLARLHGGFAGAESVFGKGSTFTVSIPLNEADAALAGAAPLPETPPSGRAHALAEEASRWIPEGAAGGADRPPAAAMAKRPSLLVADDNADMREYIRRLLEAAYEVRTATDGEAALAMAREKAPDLLLTDVMMPRLDGFQLLSAIRADRGLAHLPVIMLSARAGEAASIEGLAKGADDYLVKPFSARELLARVDRSLAVAGRKPQAGPAIVHAQATGPIAPPP